jgi:hypothetical protein
MKIDTKPVNLHQQKIKSAGECIIELSKDRLRHRMSFTADEPVDRNDESLGWEQKMNDFDVIVKKDSIVAVEKWKCTNIDRWKIIISVNGMASDVTIYFRTEAAAIPVFDKIVNWIFDGNQD